MATERNLGQKILSQKVSRHDLITIFISVLSGRFTKRQFKKEAAARPLQLTN